MRPRCFALSVFVLLASIAAAAAQPQAASRTDFGPLPSIEEKTAGLKKLDGYFPLYWDERTGQLCMEISRFGTEVLHSTGFGAGLGSNDIGIDRGALAGSRIVVLRARRSQGPAGRSPTCSFRVVEHEPGRSARGAGRVRALGAVGLPGRPPSRAGRVLVDATEFLVRDATNAAQRLRPGTYRLDPRAARSTCR